MSRLLLIAFALALALLGLSACQETLPKHRDAPPVTAPVSVPKPSPAEPTRTSYSAQMSCLRRQIEVYRYGMAEPLRIYVWQADDRPDARLDAAGQEMNARLLAVQFKTGVTETDPARVQLVEPPVPGAAPPTNFDLAIKIDLVQKDQGVVSRSERDDFALEIKKFGGEISDNEEFGITQIELAARVLLPSGLSSPLPLHVRYSARLMYRVKEKRYGVGLLGLTYGNARSQVLVDGTDALTRLIGQQMVFQIVSRQLGVPAWRCLGLGPSAGPDEAWRRIFNGRVSRWSNTELIMRLQESLVESGQFIKVTGQIDRPTLDALTHHGVGLATAGAAQGGSIDRKALEAAFFKVYTTQPIDVNLVRRAKEHLRTPGVMSEGLLAFTLQQPLPLVVTVDNRRYAVQPCGRTEIPLPVGDHVLTYGQALPTRTPPGGKPQEAQMVLLESGVITVQGQREISKTLGKPSRRGCVATQAAR